MSWEEHIEERIMCRSTALALKCAVQSMIDGTQDEEDVDLVIAHVNDLADAPLPKNVAEYIFSRVMGGG